MGLLSRKKKMHTIAHNDPEVDQLSALLYPSAAKEMIDASDEPDTMYSAQVAILQLEDALRTGFPNHTFFKKINDKGEEGIHCKLESSLGMNVNYQLRPTFGLPTCDELGNTETLYLNVAAELSLEGPLITKQQSGLFMKKLLETHSLLFNHEQSEKLSAFFAHGKKSELEKEEGNVAHRSEGINLLNELGVVPSRAVESFAIMMYGGFRQLDFGQYEQRLLGLDVPELDESLPLNVLIREGFDSYAFSSFIGSADVLTEELSGQKYFDSPIYGSQRVESHLDFITNTKELRHYLDHENPDSFNVLETSPVDVLYSPIPKEKVFDALIDTVVRPIAVASRVSGRTVNYWIQPRGEPEWIPMPITNLRLPRS